MLTVEIDAKVTWPDGTRLPGKLALNYLSEVDPWLIHLTFEVAQAKTDIDVERLILAGAVNSLLPAGNWVNTEGAPLRIGRGGAHIRFRHTDINTGSWADFDVDCDKLRTFIAKTEDLCDGWTERTAMNSYIEKALGELT